VGVYKVRSEFGRRDSHEENPLSGFAAVDFRACLKLAVPKSFVTG
jgi:hypothetical protein